MTKITIIGSRLSGLSVAHLLKDYADITLFEKARGVSGLISKPFHNNVADGKLFTPEYSAEKLLDVLENSGPEYKGKCFAWDVLEHEKILLEYIKTNDISVIGTPKYAFYNPPWTLPPMRRNEVMIELQGQ